MLAADMNGGQGPEAAVAYTRGLDAGGLLHAGAPLEREAYAVLTTCPALLVFSPSKDDSQQPARRALPAQRHAQAISAC